MDELVVQIEHQRVTGLAKVRRMATEWLDKVEAAKSEPLPLASCL